MRERLQAWIGVGSPRGTGGAHQAGGEHRHGRWPGDEPGQAPALEAAAHPEDPSGGPSERGENSYLAIREDTEMATREQFFMAWTGVE